MRRVVLLLAVLALGIAGSCATAAAKPTVYPVTFRVMVKSAELPPDSKWWHFPGVTAETPVIVTYGRVISPKPACRRNQPIRAIYQSAYESYEDKSTDVRSDATGYWEGEATPDFGFIENIRTGKARFRVKVVRKQLGKGRFCAEAISSYLRA
jgi:hypothetical protein